MSDRLFKNTLFVFSTLILISCLKNGVNKDFRKNILPNAKIQKDTLVMFDKILDKLDDKNIKFSEYYNKTRYKIQDSCGAIINKKYADLLSNGEPKSPETSEELYQMTMKALDDYNKKIGIDEKEDGIINNIGVTNVPIKKYLSKEIGIDMYIPEEDAMDRVK